MPLAVHSRFHEPTSTWSYVVHDTGSRAAAIIDPVLDYDPAAGATGTESAVGLLAHVREQNLQVRWILETHAHADHLTAADWLKKQLPGAQTAIGHGIVRVQQHFARLFNLGSAFAADGSQFDRLLQEGDTLPLGDLQIRVLETPGHTPDGLTYLIDDCAFVGDSIFMPDMGTARVDFPGGDAGELYESIGKLFALPDETRLYMCHDYAPGGRKHANVTTVGEEKSGNIHAGTNSTPESFRQMREQRDAGLGAPRLLYPAIQVNIRAGMLPPEEDNGIAYIRVPLNRFRDG